jgi:hypothetical protein
MSLLAWQKGEGEKRDAWLKIKVRGEGSFPFKYNAFL